MTKERATLAYRVVTEKKVFSFPGAGKSAFCPAATFPFVIPSEAEGSAVPRTSPGDVFRGFSDPTSPPGTPIPRRLY
jgi:hypothetical protein